MSANGRPPSFQFYPRDFVADPAVRMMTAEQRGAYIMLLCAAWSQPEAGVLQESHCEALSELPSDRWAIAKAAIARAFDTSTPGLWIQKRMVEERAAQERRHERASSGAKSTNAARWGYVAQRPPSDRSEATDSESRSVSLASASASAENQESLVSHVDQPTAQVVMQELNKLQKSAVTHDWKKAFEQHFWPTYRAYRPDGKAAAGAVWMRIEPKTEANFNTIMDGLEAQVAKWKAENTEPKFIPHARTWLFQKRWLDFERGAT